jgi:hypothetical protein
VCLPLDATFDLEASKQKGLDSWTQAASLADLEAHTQVPPQQYFWDADVGYGSRTYMHSHVRTHVLTHSLAHARAHTIAHTHAHTGERNAILLCDIYTTVTSRHCKIAPVSTVKTLVFSFC